MTVVIRTARPSDRLELIRLARLFAETEPYRDLFRGSNIDIDHQLASVVDLLFELGDDAVVFLAVDADDVPYAALALVANVNLLTGERFADELAWFVEPSYRNHKRVGPYLLRWAEEWAHAKGLRSIKMVAPIPSKVGNFYMRAGYSPIETAYRKVF